MGPDVGGLSTEGAKCANEMHGFVVIDQKGDEVVKPSVEDNYTEFGLMGDMQPAYDCAMNMKGKHWEVQGRSAETQLTQVQGRLKACVKYWEDVLHAPPTVIDWIQNGYKLALLHMPTPFCQSNHGSAIQNKEFVTDSLRELIKGRCVRRLSSKPYICSPLSVVSSSSGKITPSGELAALKPVLEEREI